MYFIARRLLMNSNFIVNKEIQRSFARRRPVANPGIHNRKELVDDTVIDLEEYDLDLESDFMNVGSTYDEHIKEIQHQKNIEQHLIVKHKYFKEKSPNFLSWADKEQIRYLHKSDPEEWTVQKLAEGFPALPQVVAKILKATWTKKSVHKIQSHDRAVQENWKLFKENKLPDLNPKLVEHLHKFTNRNIENTNQVITSPPITREKQNNHRMKIGNEFSNIITSYEHIKNKNESNLEKLGSYSNKNVTDKPVNSDTYVLGGVKSSFSKHITLKSLEDKITKKKIEGMSLTEDEVLLQNAAQESKELNIVKKPLNEITFNMYKSSTTKLLSVTKKKDDSYLLQYPMKITIPKNKLKQGCTYKLNDCYYDDDGLFLYRVPGMCK